jgi:hypothetical protein
LKKVKSFQVDADDFFSVLRLDDDSDVEGLELVRQNLDGVDERVLVAVGYQGWKGTLGELGFRFLFRKSENF